MPSPTPPIDWLTFGDGTYRVPDDIAPGTYRTTTYTDNCYWTRLSGFVSGLRDLIASRIGSGYQVVTIGEQDAGFDSVSCGTWTADLGRVTDSQAEFGEGTYVVGTDILPGEYTAVGGASCTWERLGGFGGTRRERVERVLRAGEQPRVTIEATDVGFSSGGCGTWTAL